jgi:hypothetical protein
MMQNDVEISKDTVSSKSKEAERSLGAITLFTKSFHQLGWPKIGPESGSHEATHPRKIWGKLF